MTQVSIVEAEEGHTFALARLLREGDREEIRLGGMTSVRSLLKCYRLSLVRRTAFVDDTIAAMFGCAGSPLGLVGRPWLLTSPAVERVPITFLKEGRKAVNEMLGIYPRLEGFVLSSYGGACALLWHLGFDLSSPQIAGPRGGAFRKFSLERA